MVVGALDWAPLERVASGPHLKFVGFEARLLWPPSSGTWATLISEARAKQVDQYTSGDLPGWGGGEDAEGIMSRRKLHLSTTECVIREIKP